MKKTLMTCLAVVARVRDCERGGRRHVHHRSASRCDAARPVLPGQLRPGRRPRHAPAPDARDTIVTIGNASSAPMIAHVNVYNRYSSSSSTSTSL